MSSYVSRSCAYMMRMYGSSQSVCGRLLTYLSVRDRGWHDDQSLMSLHRELDREIHACMPVASMFLSRLFTAGDNASLIRLAVRCKQERELARSRVLMHLSWCAAFSVHGDAEMLRRCASKLDIPSLVSVADWMDRCGHQCFEDMLDALALNEEMAAIFVRQFLVLPFGALNDDG